jgi:hypothetical protein
MRQTTPAKTILAGVALSGGISRYGRVLRNNS